MTTATDQAKGEARIGAAIDEWADAIRAKNANGALSHFATDSVWFDLARLLRFVTTLMTMLMCNKTRPGARQIIAKRFILPIIILVLGTLATAQSRATSVRDACFVTKDSTRIHYLDSGQNTGAPTLVLIPGWRLPAGIWESQIQHFSNSRRVIAIDSRSQGDSTKTTEGNTPEVRAADLKELMTKLGLTQVVLVGWSQGAQDVAAYVGQFGQEKLAGLVLVDSPVSAGPDEVELRPEFVKQELGMLAIFAAHPKEYSEGMAAAIPTLIVAASDSPLFEAEKEMGTHMANSKFMSMGGVGHALFVDDPVKFNELLEQFLDGLNTPPVSAAVVLSAPNEKSKFMSSDRAKPEVITNSIGMKLVRIPSGEFMMGAEEDVNATKAAFPYADPALLPRESPRHKVRITKSFYMGQYEVTLGQFMTFLRETGYKIDAERDGKPMTGYGKNRVLIESTAFRPWAPGWKVGPDHPVGYVSWNDAVAFCDWLSRKEDKKYRLPNEAEWEYACRAGTSSRYYSGNDPESLIGFANVADADRAAEFPGKTAGVFDKSGKKTGERIPYPFLSGHDGYAWTAPICLERGHTNA